jgi:hypothetical protein
MGKMRARRLDARGRLDDFDEAPAHNSFFFDDLGNDFFARDAVGDEDARPDSSRPMAWPP